MNNKGFSLIELLAIITILGLIMGVAVISQQKHVTKTRQAGYNTLITTARTAAQNRFIDDGLGIKCMQYDITNDLYLGGYMDKPADPASTSENCNGKVSIKTDDSGNVENYYIKVDLDCSVYDTSECKDSGGADCSSISFSECSNNGSGDTPGDNPPSVDPDDDEPGDTPGGDPDDNQCTIAKPAKPEIENPTNGNWTNKPFSLTVKTATLGSEIGYWYYSYEKDGEYIRYDESYGKSSYNTTNFVLERNQPVYIKVCNSCGDDSENCSDVVSTMIRIDKTPPLIKVLTSDSLICSRRNGVVYTIPHLQVTDSLSQVKTFTDTRNDGETEAMDIYYREKVDDDFTFVRTNHPLNNPTPRNTNTEIVGKDYIVKGKESDNVNGPGIGTSSMNKFIDLTVVRACDFADNCTEEFEYEKGRGSTSLLHNTNDRVLSCELWSKSH